MDERTLRGVEVVKASLDGLNHSISDVALHIPNVNTMCAYDGNEVRCLVDLSRT